MITFISKDKKVELENHPTKSLAELAAEAGFFLNMRCGGQGSCGGCAVTLQQGEYLFNQQNIVLKEKEHRTVLSCKTKILSENAVVSISDAALIELNGKIDFDFKLRNFTEDTQTKKFLIHLPSSNLENVSSEKEKLQEELLKVSQIKNIYLPLEALQKLAYALKDENREITVTIGRIRSYWFVINVEAGDSTQINLGVAVDIGTTTVAGILIDLSNSKILAKASRYNQQITKADDVASRISYASTPQKVKYLQKLIINDTINPIIEELCKDTGFKPEQINRMAVSGNTVMTHLFLGISPEPLGKLPFEPIVKVVGEYLAKDIGIEINDHGIIDITPAISAYIGGDISSDIYVSQMHISKGLTLMVDIGTNGEMIFSNNGELIACATPAGPAFEGAGLKHGCRAISGAIDAIRFNHQGLVEFTTIGGVKAKGICGSGMIDFIAEALRANFLSPNGRYDIEKLKDKDYFVEVEEKGFKLKAIVVAKAEQTDNGKPITISEADIAQILQAKAAIYSGLKTLIETQNITFKQLDKFILAGGFAKHINLKNAITMGLLPYIALDKIEVIGNGSLAGAFLTLVEPEAIKDMREISQKPLTIELNLIETFQNNFIDALFIPSADPEAFYA